MYVSSKAFHGMVLMLSFATPSSSISSSWEEKGQEEDIYTKYVRRTSSRAASTKDAADEGSGGSLDDIQVTPRELKSGKKNLLAPPVLPFAQCDGPGVAAAESTSCDMPPVFSDTDLDSYCVGCPDMTMKVEDFLALAPVLAGADPFCSTFAYGSTAATNSDFTLGDPFLEGAACLVDYVQGVSQIEDDSFIYKVDEEYKKAVMDFCVHKCGEDFWGLLKEIQSPTSTTEDFIHAKCLMTSEAATACDSGTFVCKGMEHSVIFGNACNGNFACNQMKFSVVGMNSCISNNPGQSAACQGVVASTIAPNSCTGNYACESVLSVNITSNSCTGNRACVDVGFKTIGTNACDGTDACAAASGMSGGEIVESYIGNSACMGESACESATSVNIGNGACVGTNACKNLAVDVGKNACTCEDCCNCNAVKNNVDYMANGIPEGKCTALDEVDCCPVC
jgi:hypothetical protein